MKDFSDSLLLRNCQLVNVNSGEIYPTDITVEDGSIVSISPNPASDAANMIDCQGLYALPGLIDPHMHVDTTLLWPGELGRVLVPLGTTTVMVDTTNIFYTGGMDAVRALVDSFQGLPLNAWFSVSSYCPLDPDLETSAVELTLHDLETMLSWPKTLGIGETVWTKIRGENPKFLDNIALCQTRDKRISGHGDDLAATHEADYDGYAAAGIIDDHNCANGVDILPRLRRGMTLFMVEAPGRDGQLARLLKEVVQNKIPTRQMCLCVDNIVVTDIVTRKFGYLDHLLQIALKAGIPPIDAIRMATLNPAQHFRKADLIGSLAPGRQADILLVRNLNEFPPEYVFSAGRLVAQSGKLVVDIPQPNYPQWYKETIKLKPSISIQKLAIPGIDPGVTVRIILAKNGSAYNRCFTSRLNSKEGIIQPDIQRDILKIVMLDRYGHTDNVAIGFVTGFGLKRGALATSVSMPSNNIVAVGTCDEDIWVAIKRIEEMQGGYVVVCNSQILAETRLPIGGIISDGPYEKVVADIDKTNAAARTLGCALENPFFTAVQTVHPTIAEVGLTDRGLVDAATGQILPVIV